MSSSSTVSSPPEDQGQTQDPEKLFAEIKRLAEAKDFAGAEKLRETLMEAAPFALEAIIDSAEIIEKEKSEGIDPDHLALWDDLYNDLNEEERNCIFYSMKKVVAPTNRRILGKGKYNDRLYFIEDGNVAVYKTKGDKNIVVAKLGRGNLLGEYTFTTISLCSASVLTQSDVTMYCLQSSATDDWEDKYPGLLKKLTDFCDRKGNLSDIDRRRKEEKWKYPRHKVQEGTVTANLLTKDGEKTDKFFHGKLLDVSRDGTSFGLEIQNKNTARALLTQRFSVDFRCRPDCDDVDFTAEGKVVRVSFKQYSSYTVHVHFNELMEEKILNSITGGKEEI